MGKERAQRWISWIACNTQDRCNWQAVQVADAYVAADVPMYIADVGLYMMCAASEWSVGRGC
jgi:hypothetical protein